MASKTLTTIVIVFACIILFPVLIGVVGGLFGIIMGIFGMGIGMIAGIFGGIAGAIGGFFGWIFGGWHFGLFHWHIPVVLTFILIIILISRRR